MAEVLEALGAVCVVAGLALWSLPISLLAAGLFLLVVANAPGGRPPVVPPGQTGHRAEDDDVAEREAMFAELDRQRVMAKRDDQ